MPSNHTLLEKEMRAFRAENPSLSDPELRRKVLELRNLPTDRNAPFWKELSKRKSTLGKFRPRGEHFDSLFKLALEHIEKDNP